MGGAHGADEASLPIKTPARRELRIRRVTNALTPNFSLTPPSKTIATHTYWYKHILGGSIYSRRGEGVNKKIRMPGTFSAAINVTSMISMEYAVKKGALMGVLGNAEPPGAANLILSKRKNVAGNDEMISGSPGTLLSQIGRDLAPSIGPKSSIANH